MTLQITSETITAIRCSDGMELRLPRHAVAGRIYCANANPTLRPHRLRTMAQDMALLELQGVTTTRAACTDWILTTEA